MAERNVTFLILAKDFASGVMDRVGGSTDRAAKKLRDLNTIGLGPVATAGAALGPALLPVMGAAVVGTAALGIAFAGAGAAAGVFGAVAKSTFTEVADASKKSDDLRTKIRLLNSEISLSAGNTKKEAALTKARNQAMLEYRARLQELPAPTRAAVLALDGLKSGWQRFVDAQKPTVLPLMARGMDALARALPKLQPLFDAGARAARGLLGAFEYFVSGGMLDSAVRFLANTAGPAFESFGGILISFASGLGSLFAPFIQTVPGVVGGLDDISLAFAGWARGTGQQGVRDLIAYVVTNGPAMGDFFSGLASSIGTLAQAAAPLAPISLAIATGLTQIINALPQPVLTAMVGSFIAWSVALRGAMIITQLASIVGIFAGAIVGVTAVLTGSTLATEANTAAKVAFAITTGIVTVAQWAWNAALIVGAGAMALLTSPIFLVIAGIALLAAGFIYAYRHSERFHAIVQAAMHGAAAAIRWLGDAFTTVWSTIQRWWSNTLGFFSALPGRIMGAVLAFPGMYARFWRWTMERAAYYIGYGIGRTIRFFMDLPGQAMRAVRALQGMWSVFWLAVWNRAKTLTINGANAVAAFFSSLPGRAGRAVSSLWGRISGAFSSAYSNMRSYASRAVSGAVAYFSQLPGRAWSAIRSTPGRIQSVFSGAGSWLYSAGRNIIMGLVSGIGNAAGAAVGEARRIAGSIVSGVMSGLGIGSPSRVMADKVGRWIPPGIMVGLRSAMPALLGDVGSAMSDVSDAASVSARSSFDLGVGGGPAGPQSLPAGLGRRGGDTIVIQVSGALDPMAVGKQLVQILSRWATLNGKTFELST